MVSNMGNATCVRHNCPQNSNFHLFPLTGLPLPVVGMLAYGVVTFLGLQLGKKKASINKADGEVILAGTTTSMAAASAYFLYILSTEFPGETCSYCVGSAVLSFTLFFLTLKVFLSKIISFLSQSHHLVI